MQTTTLNPLFNPLITIICIVGFIYLLIIAKIVFIPLALGLLFAFFLMPAVRKLEKMGVPRIVANLIMIILAIAFVVGVGILLSYAVSQFIGDLPLHKAAIQNNIVNIQEWVAKISKIPVTDQQVWVTENINFLELGAKNVGTLATSIGKVITTFSLTFIYTFFILYYRNKMMMFIQKLFGNHNEATILTTLKKLIRIIPRYLGGVVAVMIILGIVNSLGFWIIGVPNPIFFGTLAAILNVIPYAGPIIGFGIVVLFCLATTGPGIALATIIMFIVIQFLENNILTPNIAGGTISINPFTSIIGIILGGVIWGPIGMIIALPVIGMIKVIFDSIPNMQPYGYLIGDEGTEDHALSFQNIKKVFTRKKA